MDDDQRAALVGYLLMRPVVERIELCSQVQSQGRIRFLDYGLSKEKCVLSCVSMACR